MSNITLQKLDGRHSLSHFFTHRARLIGIDDIHKWIEMRNWLWENYGPGLERDTVWLVHYKKLECPQWAWHVDDRKYYLYLKDEVLTHFTLRWMNT